MTIRFLQTVPSENPEMPFRAGQVITVTYPSPMLLDYLDGERAELVREDATESAVLVPAEQPEPSRKGRRHGRV